MMFYMFILKFFAVQCTSYSGPLDDDFPTIHVDSSSTSRLDLGNESSAHESSVDVVPAVVEYLVQLVVLETVVDQS